MNKNKFVVLFSFMFEFYCHAQCAMCRASLEGDANTAVAEGVNDGIVYLMAIPYILVALGFYAIYKLKFTNKKDK